mmetsp:Transcript_3726/g.13090  ORF Transcript_3726/g.13090 Transcript_3726/m.13090 type:complete len:223 (-) Transcript_3726:329-997(-)
MYTYKNKASLAGGAFAPSRCCRGSTRCPPPSPLPPSERSAFLAALASRERIPRTRTRCRPAPPSPSLPSPQRPRHHHHRYLHRRRPRERARSRRPIRSCRRNDAALPAPGRALTPFWSRTRRPFASRAPPPVVEGHRRQSRIGRSNAFACRCPRPPAGPCHVSEHPRSPPRRSREQGNVASRSSRPRDRSRPPYRRPRFRSLQTPTTTKTPRRRLPPPRQSP